jgi:undecaprenyl-diphosphatase
VAFGFLAVLLAREMRHTTWRWVPYAVAGATVLAIAFSRIYLGVHWLSDTLGGFTLGIVWVAVLGIAYYRHRPPPVPLAGLVGAVALAMVLAGTWHIARSHETDLGRYTQASAPRLLPADAWWAGRWRELPALRIDLRDRPRQPLDLHWAGPLEPLRARLAATGWQEPPALSGTNLLRLLTPHPAETELPVVPQLLDGRYDTLRLVRPAAGGEGRLLVVRLWESGVHLTPSDIPLWVGYAGCLEPWQPVPWVTVLRTSTCLGVGLGALRESLAGLDLRTVYRDPPPGSVWDGTVLLVWAH